MRYNKIRNMDISNGHGVRVSIFVQGCTFNCEDCFNPETHDFNGGKEFTEEKLNQLMNLCDKPQIKGLSILGGEPLHDINLDGVFKIVSSFRKRFPNKDIWLWTGFRFEDIINDDKRRCIIEEINYLIDGRFIKEQKNISLKWAGSKNQRVIDIRQTLEQNRIILLED